jgi:glucose/arabinose dehydrogenase
MSPKSCIHSHLHIVHFCAAMFLVLVVPFTLTAQLPTAFQKVELISGLKNSVNFEFAPDGRIFIIDRYGELFIYNTTTQTQVTAGVLPVFHDMEDGLLAIAFDPNFTSNNWIYLHYSHQTLPKNRVSRFTMNGDVLELSSELVVLEWGSDRNGYYHAAGDMDFDTNGNLYIAIGDNSNHTGYAALNESDFNQSAERSSSNTNDLRGKILRIHPEPDGSYSIPSGNLFPAGLGGRPEIYVMGARNPFKISIDKATNWLFWGEVGPDANVESENGPEGMDEINLVKSAGNYGWPYLSGKNEPYLNTYANPRFYFDYTHPVNISKWNTGARDLPPAKPSWLEFFHACYLAGPRYYFDASINNVKKLPSDFHQGFFYFDFNTSKIWVVHMDAAGNITANRPFAANVVTGSGFIDLKIGPNGQLYLLEYGAGCCPNNVGTGKLSRIDYIGINTNKAPQVTLTADVISGSLPLTVNFSSAGTVDLDGDALTFEWDFESDGIVDSNLPSSTHIFPVKGTFVTQLRVTDAQGEASSRSITIYPGNSPANIVFNTPPDGGMFAWEDQVQFNVTVADAEDGSTADNSINCQDVNFVPSFGHLNHSHDGISQNTCATLFELNDAGHDTQGQDNIYYIFKVNYTDRDNLSVFDQVTIYPRTFEVEFFDAQSNTKVIDNTDALGGGVSAIRALTHNSYIKLKGRNLQGISSVSYRVASTVGGTIELHADSPDGPLLSTAAFPVTGDLKKWTNASAALTDPGGKHDLYLVFKKEGAINILDLNYLEFIGSGVSLDTSPVSIYSLQILSQTQIRLKYNEAVEESSAEALGNYSISNGVRIGSVVLQDDGKTVLLNTSPITLGIQNQITIRSIRNITGVPMLADVVMDFTMDEVLARINVGGPLVDLAGEQWEASKYNTGGTVGATPNRAISNTTADVLYQTELSGNFTINVPVANATLYDVRLHFAELVYKNVGGRVFNINIENGQYSLTNFDIYKKVGYNAALIETFENIKVEDGLLTISFTGVVNKAKLCALEVNYGDQATQVPSITILNPGENFSLAQPFNVNFKVENLWVAPGSSRIQYIVDSVKQSDIYSNGQITVEGLSPGMHTIQLMLTDDAGVPIQISDQVQVNVVQSGVCIDNPFPSVWEEIILGPDLPYKSPHMFAADINGDGLKDVVTGGWWYANPGSPKGGWTRYVVGAPMNNMFLIHDFDRDGDPDILGTQGSYLGTKLAWAQNDGNGNFIIHTNISDAIGYPAGTTLNNVFLAGAAVGNFNNVANIQVAIVWNGSETTKAPVKMLTVPADPVNTVWSAADIAPNAVGEAIHAIDIDKDGDLDLSQMKNWLRNDNGIWTTFSTGITLATYYEHHAINDFNKDGILDGVATQIGENQEITAFKVAADPTKVWTKSTLGTDVDSGLSLDIADLDFDGDLDLIVGEWKSEKRLLAFENDLCGSGTWTKHILHAGGTTKPDHHDGTQTVDLDNDGDLDIISLGWDKRTPRIFINNGSTVSGNTAPVVANPIPDQPSVANTVFSYVIPANTFTDPDNDALSFTATLSSGANLPPWLTFNGSLRSFQGTSPVGASQNVLIKVTVTDGKGGTASDEFAIIFPNFPPVVSNPIPDQSTIVGQAILFTFAANAFTDGNGDALTYSATLLDGAALPAWLSFNGSTRTFSGTPSDSDVGVLDIMVTASDLTASVSDVFSYTLLENINQPPVVANPIPAINVSAGVPFSFAFNANCFSDANQDPLTFAAQLSNGSPLPQWLIFTGPARTFSGTPSSGDLGAIEITVTASDDSASVSQNFILTVENGSGIRMNSGGPVFQHNGVTFDADKYYKGGGTYVNNNIADIAGTDLDALYKTERNNAFGYEVPLAPGTYTVRLHFAEIYFGATGGGQGGAGKRVFNVLIEGQPMLSNFDVYAEAGGAMKALVKQFQITVGDGILNINFVKVIQNPKVSAVEIVGVAPAPNGIPIVSNPITDQVATTGSAYAFTFAAGTFTDPDSDPLTYSAKLLNGDPLPSWLTFTPSTRTFSGTPAPADAGSLSIDVTASDGKGGLVADNFTLTINLTSTPPLAVRINSGGPQFTSLSTGVVFAADNGYVGGSVYTNSKVVDIAGTTDDAIYKTERNKLTGYDIPLPSGNYQVRLHFAEIYFGATGGGIGGIGKRVFNVSAEGNMLLTNFDIYAEAGAMAALVKEFDVAVSDGALNIRFIKVLENVKVSALEIIAIPETHAAAQRGEQIVRIDSEASPLIAYPNPFSGTTTIQYQPDVDDRVSLHIVNPQGVVIKELFTGDVEAGKLYSFEFDATGTSAGFFFGRLTTKDKSAVIKLAVIR